MSEPRLEELRTPRFPTARRGGYDPEAVDNYLFQLADWLETDEAKGALARREIELVGERTSAILGAAQAGADRITAEATADADEVRSRAEREIAEAREAADAYAAQTRSSADADARRLVEEAQAEATRVRQEADEHARLTIREADDRLVRAAREAEERTAGVEKEIATLVRKREELLDNMRAIGTALEAVVAGPGAAKIEIPERARTASAFTEPVAHPEIAEAPPVEDDADEEEVLDEEDVPEPPATVMHAVDEDVEIDDDPGPVVRDGEETRPYNVEFDTDEDLYEDERPPDPIPASRDGSRRGDEPTTEDGRLSGLL